MANESKGDTKLFQIFMVVVTSIIAPISVYFLTHLVQIPSPTAASPTPLSTLVSEESFTASPDYSILTSTVEPSNTMTPQQQTATAIPGIFNPVGILPAGEWGIVNGIAVLVVPDDTQIENGIARIHINIRNLSGFPQTFSYRIQSIAMKDEGGRTLEVMYGDKHKGCAKKDLSSERKIELASNQEIILQSVEANIDLIWCASEETLLLPLYQVATRETPKSIVIQFNNFGPFNGFGFKIDL